MQPHAIGQVCEAIETAIHQDVFAAVQVAQGTDTVTLVQQLLAMPEYALSSVALNSPAETVLFGTVGGKGWAVRVSSQGERQQPAARRSS